MEKKSLNDKLDAFKKRFDYLKEYSEDSIKNITEVFNNVFGKFSFLSFFWFNSKNN